MSEDIKEKLHDHDLRLVRVEGRLDSAQADISDIKKAVGANNVLIADVRDKVNGMVGFQRGANWLLGIAFAALTAAIAYFGTIN